MPKKVSTAELDAIVKAVAKFPSGASVDAIGNLTEITLPRRTLQRRLARLVEQQRLTMQGQGPGTRYQLPTQDTSLLRWPHSSASFSHFILSSTNRFIPLSN